MSRHSRYRELQASVPGLESLYVAIGDSVASACTAQSNVLIVGGGGGREIELLAQQKARARLTVVDPSSSNLREAEAKVKETGYRGPVEFVEGVVEDLPLGRNFDVVTLIFVLHTIHELENEISLLKSVRSRMTRSGKLFLADMCAMEHEIIEDAVAAYKDYARSQGTAEDLIELEVGAVLARQDRTVLSFFEKIEFASFKITRKIGRAKWYAAFEVDL